MIFTVDLMAVIMGIIVVSAFVIWLVCIAVEAFINLFKKNCYDCKHYKLYDVASAGDWCWYECKLKDEKDLGTSMNTKCKYTWCRHFENNKEDTK